MKSLISEPRSLFLANQLLKIYLNWTPNEHIIQMAQYTKEVEEFVAKISQKNAHEKEFIQAVSEVAETIVPYVEQNKKYKEANILERMCEPERVIIFRVPWQDKDGNIQVNRGFRVQMNSAIGPYKGGLRFHPSVNL